MTQDLDHSHGELAQATGLWHIVWILGVGVLRAQRRGSGPWALDLATGTHFYTLLTHFLDRIGSDQIGSDRIGLDRIGSDRIGSDRVGSDRVGSERIGSGRVGCWFIRQDSLVNT